MNDRDRVEEARLWTIVLVLSIPNVVSKFILFFGDKAVKGFSNYWWSTGLGLILSALLITLPFLWKGHLSWKEISKRVFRRADSVSILLALAPIVIWAMALVLLTAQSSYPYYLRFPIGIFQKSEYQIHALLSTFIISWNGLLGILIFANASQYANRIKFLLIYSGLGVVFEIVNYRCALTIIGPAFAEMAYRLSNPYPVIVHYLGFTSVVLGLIHRGRSSITAVATMLGSYWLARTIGIIGDIRAMSIGLFGGAALIFLVNYLQQSGRWTPFSFEKHT